MKKGLTAVAVTFLSLSMLSACGTTQNWDLTDNDDKVGYQPVRYNPYKEMNHDNMTKDNRFITGVPNREGYQYHADSDFNLQALPRLDKDQRIVQNRDGSHFHQNQTARNQLQNSAPPSTNKNVETPNNKVTSGDFQTRVVQLTNQERQKNGLNALIMDTKVSKVAQTKAEDMASNNYFSHTSPTYGSPFKMLKDFGVDYKTAAENIAQGQTTPEQVVNSWMNSSGHRQNILSKDITHIGVGYSKDGNNWSQMFIGK